MAKRGADGTTPVGHITLDELMEKNMLKSNDIVMFIGLGAGLTWGGVIYKLL